MELVQLGSPVELTAGTPYYADNGDKTPIFREIKDRFEGTGDYEGAAAGTDRYAGPGGGSDSWVVAFPVFSCQSDSHCAGGSPARVEGFVCFEIREVEDAPGKVIRGRFLCSGDALMSECNLGPTGSSGKDFGIRADIPLLVR